MTALRSQLNEFQIERVFQRITNIVFIFKQESIEI